MHGIGQRAHVDLDLSAYSSSKRSCEELLRDALNFHLRLFPLAVCAVVKVGDDFHARFSAKSRTYLYRVVVSPQRPVLRAGRVWHRRLTSHVRSRLGDRGLIERVSTLREHALSLLGEHDFSAFRAAGCQSRSPIKNMHSVDVTHRGDELRFTFCASGFLYRQVRMMVSTLVALGEGRLAGCTIDDFLRAPSSRFARRIMPTLAPAHGLYFVSVDY